jgi:capsule biosynthesis phosphatase
MRLAIDVDGTICETRTEAQSYLDVQPLPNAIESIKKLKAEGHYIIIFTGRGMNTYDGNLGKVLANRAPELILWLKRHEIPYDELVMGKPHYDRIIDDKAIKFNNWTEILSKI